MRGVGADGEGVDVGGDGVRLETARDGRGVDVEAKVLVVQADQGVCSEEPRICLLYLELVAACKYAYYHTRQPW